ncbi:TetR/AcrR family transcriptional regulator [Hylemonella gracilis]|uniref:TetR family transcriptional regulator n=1 Tax=Hylemonella gracilis ATCC 19624 TaxID=887062 RepID=F3KXC6_9BURK|nr:TetR family transcriptional regulator [Hylemonella gracilis]EGI75493.1 TetR family transcriptional regulator [Hylemonella gracilis ATCC 19624]
MKITKAQSQENRARIVETASTLFRERGFDGVSVADLMVAAGLTHGGFYKHFGSKADLMTEATAQGLVAKMSEYQDLDTAEFIARYLSREHRDERGDGCTMAALSGDAARQPPAVQAAFASGIASMLAAVERGAMAAGADQGAARAKAISLFSQMLGALVLSRACPDDSPLSDEILDVCRRQILTALVPVGGIPRSRKR